MAYGRFISIILKKRLADKIEEEEGEVLNCHKRITPKLFEDWKKNPHARKNKKETVSKNSSSKEKEKSLKNKGKRKIEEVSEDESEKVDKHQGNKTLVIYNEQTVLKKRKQMEKDKVDESSRVPKKGKSNVNVQSMKQKRSTEKSKTTAKKTTSTVPKRRSLRIREQWKGPTIHGPPQIIEIDDDDVEEEENMSAEKEGSNNNSTSEGDNGDSMSEEVSVTPSQEENQAFEEGASIEETYRRNEDMEVAQVVSAPTELEASIEPNPEASEEIPSPATEQFCDQDKEDQYAAASVSATEAEIPSPISEEAGTIREESPLDEAVPTSATKSKKSISKGTARDLLIRLRKVRRKLRKERKKRRIESQQHEEYKLKQTKRRKRDKKRRREEQLRMRFFSWDQNHLPTFIPMLPLLRSIVLNDQSSIKWSYSTFPNLSFVAQNFPRVLTIARVLISDKPFYSEYCSNQTISVWNIQSSAQFSTNI